MVSINILGRKDMYLKWKNGTKIVTLCYHNLNNFISSFTLLKSRKDQISRIDKRKKNTFKQMPSNLEGD